VNRRNYVRLAGSFSIAALAGCLGATGDSPADSNGSEATESDAGESDTPQDSTDSAPTTTESDAVEGEPADAIRAYFDAIAAKDTDALRETVHSKSPFVETIDAGEVAFPDEDASQDPDPAAIETVASDPTADEILAFDAASYVFDEASLESALGENRAVLVEAAPEPTNMAMGETWVVLSESGEWRVFWAGRRPDIPENPSDVFDEEIEDADNDVVTSVDWDYDQDTDDVVSNVEWVRVNLTDSPGVDAETIRLESTIEGWETELSGGENESNGWAGSWATVALHEDGDQLVVTAIAGDTERVVHRVHYEPEK
jgi:hypothetical protein